MNDVRISDGRKSVCNNYCRSSLHSLFYLKKIINILIEIYTYFVESLLDNGFTLRVQSRSGFVQEKNFWVSHNCPSNGNSLLLPTRKLRPTFPNQCIILLENIFDDKYYFLDYDYLPLGALWWNHVRLPFSPLLWCHRIQHVLVRIGCSRKLWCRIKLALVIQRLFAPSATSDSPAWCRRRLTRSIKWKNSLADVLLNNLIA